MKYLGCPRFHLMPFTMPLVMESDNSKVVLVMGTLKGTAFNFLEKVIT